MSVKGLANTFAWGHSLRQIGLAGFLVSSAFSFADAGRRLKRLLPRPFEGKSLGDAFSGQIDVSLAPLRF